MAKSGYLDHAGAKMELTIRKIYRGLCSYCFSCRFFLHFKQHPGGRRIYSGGDASLPFRTDSMSQILIPMSFAAIFGGTTTLWELLLIWLLELRFRGLSGLGMFQLTPLGFY